MNLREWALPVYTILAQMATGALLTLWILRAVNAPKIGGLEMDRMVARPIVAIWLTIVVALFGSHLHLSMPFLSFLALANLGSSWLSREVLFTSLFFFSATGIMVLAWLAPQRVRLRTLLGWFSITAGAVSVLCMGEIYLLPSQPAWNTPLTLASFYATALLLGVMEIAVLLVMDLKFTEMREADSHDFRRDLVRRSLAWFAAAAAVMTIVVLALNFAQISRLDGGDNLARLSLDLLLGLYAPLFVIRIGLPVAGTAVLIFAVVGMHRASRAAPDLMMPAYVSCLFILVGEILGRFLFYATHIRVGI